jgi:hypothetical protein
MSSLAFDAMSFTDNLPARDCAAATHPALV